MAGIRDLVKAKLDPVSEDEVNEFGIWAFGENLEFLYQTLQFLQACNELHGDKLRITPDGYIDEDVEKMILLWKDRKLA